jgi:class 3 adenylate cyclase
VLSCSLVDAHELAEICTPEEKQVLLAALFDRAARQIQGCGGLITQYVNDGFLALFGVTTPRENHALRAVKAALELQTLLSEETLHPKLPAEILAVRMGLHTGEVIGKRFGNDPRVIYMAVGNTMQFAANLQACADPGSVLVSGVLYDLVEEAVHAEIVGFIAGDTNAPPMVAYRLDWMFSEVISESFPTTRSRAGCLHRSCNEARLCRLVSSCLDCYPTARPQLSSERLPRCPDPAKHQGQGQGVALFTLSGAI